MVKKERVGLLIVKYLKVPVFPLKKNMHIHSLKDKHNIISLYSFYRIDFTLLRSDKKEKIFQRQFNTHFIAIFRPLNNPLN
jgi:hypothetical protein